MECSLAPYARKCGGSPHDVSLPRQDFVAMLHEVAKRTASDRRHTLTLARRTRSGPYVMDWEKGGGVQTYKLELTGPVALEPPFLLVQAQRSRVPYHVFPCALDAVHDVLFVGAITWHLARNVAIVFEQQAFDAEPSVYRVMVRAPSVDEARPALDLLGDAWRTVTAPPADEESLRAMLRRAR